VSASPYRLPEHQHGSINPWRPPAAPHGGPPADSAALHELHRLRQQYQLETSDDRTWGIVGLIGCGFIVLLVPLGLLVGGWIFLLALKLGLLPIGLGYFVMHLRRNAKRIWKDAYTGMYFKLATTSLPLLIADTGHAAVATTRQSSPLAQADANSGRPDLVLTMLRAAQEDWTADPQAPRTLRNAVPGVSLLRLSTPQLDLGARARFAAIYDFFFHPQEDFHAELERAQDGIQPAAAPAAAPVD